MKLTAPRAPSRVETSSNPNPSRNCPLYSNLLKPRQHRNTLERGSEIYSLWWVLRPIIVVLDDVATCAGHEWVRVGRIVFEK